MLVKAAIDRFYLGSENKSLGGPIHQELADAYSKNADNAKREGMIEVVRTAVLGQENPQLLDDSLLYDRLNSILRAKIPSSYIPTVDSTTGLKVSTSIERGVAEVTIEGVCTMELGFLNYLTEPYLPRTVEEQE